MSWDRIKAACFRSATIAWGYIVATVGTAMQFVDGIGSALGDPNLKQQIADAFKSDPVMLGRILMAISIVTMIARARSLMKGPSS